MTTSNRCHRWRREETRGETLLTKYNGIIVTIERDGIRMDLNRLISSLYVFLYYLFQVAIVKPSNISQLRPRQSVCWCRQISPTSFRGAEKLSSKQSHWPAAATKMVNAIGIMAGTVSEPAPGIQPREIAFHGDSRCNYVVVALHRRIDDDKPSVRLQEPNQINANQRSFHPFWCNSRSATSRPLLVGAGCCGNSKSSKMSLRAMALEFNTQPTIRAILSRFEPLQQAVVLQWSQRLSL